MLKIIIIAIVFYLLGLFTRNVIKYFYKVKKSIKVYEQLQKMRKEEELKEKRKREFREKRDKLD